MDILRKIAILIALFLVTVAVPMVLIMNVGPKIFERPIREGTEIGHFTLSRMIPDAAVNGIAVGDFDNDGDQDIFAASYPEGTSTPSALFENQNGTLVERTSAYRIPEIRGSAAAFADIDNNGYPELFVSEVTWVGSPAHPFIRIRVFTYTPSARSFREITERLGLADSVRSSEATFTFADYDADGRLDMAVAFMGEIKRYNVEPKDRWSFFRTLILGAPLREGHCRPDLVRAKMAPYPELEAGIVKDFGSMEALFELKGCVSYREPTLGTPGAGRTFLSSPFADRIAASVQIPGSLHVYKNEGSTFSRATSVTYGNLHLQEGIQNKGVSGMQGWKTISYSFFQSVSFDFNGDTLPDIFAASDGGRNLILINKGNFVFVDEGGERGLDIRGTGMGVTLGDHRNSGSPEIFVSNFGQVYNFANNVGTFALNVKLSLSHLGFGWGIVTLDADNDGWRDLYISNGLRNFAGEVGSYMFRTTPENKSAYGLVNLYRNRLYMNDSGRFLDKSGTAIPDLVYSTRPTTAVDIDGNGYEDLLVGGTGSNMNRGLYVFMNKGGTHAFIQIRLRGKASNRSGVGASICVNENEITRQCLPVLIGESFSTQTSLTKTFGLGAYSGSQISVTIHWPTGEIQEISAPVNALTEVVEGHMPKN